MRQETLEEVKDLSYWKSNAEEDYMKVPISVLRYISELEERSYSEEEVIEFAKFMLFSNHEYKSYKEIFNEWF